MRLSTSIEINEVACEYRVARPAPSRATSGSAHRADYAGFNSAVVHGCFTGRRRFGAGGYDRGYLLATQPGRLDRLGGGNAEGDRVGKEEPSLLAAVNIVQNAFRLTTSERASGSSIDQPFLD